jgi:ABC-type nitrate/sulfonate/bicarbonate transport system ATPase subunit
MTVQENVELGLSSLHLAKPESERRVSEMLALVGLAEFRTAYPHELSGGMRQRAAIARALVTQPRLLLMDEPLAALDAQTRTVMQQELLTLWRHGDYTAIYVTHDIEEAVMLADRVIVLSTRPGRIVRDVEVPFGRDRTVTELRRHPEFERIALELWQVVADEVGVSLSGQPATAPV